MADNKTGDDHSIMFPQKDNPFTKSINTSINKSLATVGVQWQV